MVGSSFAAAFFVHRLLQRRPGAKIAIVERGAAHSYHDQVTARDRIPDVTDRMVSISGNPKKRWVFYIGHGGGSNFWAGQTPRMLPADFTVAAPRGDEAGWPIGYDDLEPYYCEAEEIIGVAGEVSPLFPRSRPYGHPAHKGNDLDRRLAELYPASFLIAPCARTTDGTDNRPPCCNNGVCISCPVDAKFRILNEMSRLFSAQNVDLLLGHEARLVDVKAGMASGVLVKSGNGREELLRAETVFLGANGIFNPIILQRSGLADDEFTGRGITEQLGLYADVFLKDARSFNGTTHITGISFHGCFDQSGRRPRYLVENRNSPPSFRFEKDRLLNKARLKIVMEGQVSLADRVWLDGETVRVHTSPKRRVIDDLEAVRRDFSAWINPVGVERIDFASELEETQSHIQCSTRMSASPNQGVVDHRLVHHRVRNLLVGGSSVFPNCPPSNPSLTIAALSLRAAALL